MKTTQLIAGFSAALFVAGMSAQAQSTFQNLDFEQANPFEVFGTSYVTAASALPDWTVTIGGVQQTQVTENDPATGSTWVMLAGPGENFGIVPIDGNYSVLLQGGGSPGEAAISQTGLIPAGMQSLLFEAQPILFASSDMEVIVGTQTLPLTAVRTGPNYTLYGANISTWAGETEQITFSVPSYSGNWEIDNISFSPTAITPEPGTLALVLMAGAAFGARHWRAKCL